MAYTFEWDDKKAADNKKKHGISFAEAATVFNDEHSLTIYDYQHSDYEERYIDVGQSKNGMIIVVVYTERHDNIRLISARRANEEEKRFYEKERKKKQ
jgi:uncharacterized protein